MSRGFIPPKPSQPSHPTYTPPPPRRPRSRYAIPIAVAAALLATAVGARFALTRKAGRTDAPRDPVSSTATPVAAAPAPPRPASPAATASAAKPLPPPSVADIQEFFDRLRTATAAKDPAALATLLDGPRQLRQAQSLGVLTALTPAQVEQHGNAFAAASGKRLAPAGTLHFDSVLVTRVTPLRDPDEALALTRTWQGKAYARIRWWLRRAPEATWRIYDSEHLDTGDRMSETILTTPNLDPTGAPPPPWLAHVDTLFNLRRAIARYEKDKAAALSKSLDGVPFPPPIEAARLTTAGDLQCLLNRPLDALPLYDQAEARGADTPRIHRLRAGAHLLAKQYPRAIAAARQYIQAIDDNDAYAYALIGLAHEEQKQPVEAAAAYRKALADNPEYPVAEALRRTQKTLPDAPKP
jgi:hypothetical protein